MSIVSHHNNLKTFLLNHRFLPFHCIFEVSYNLSNSLVVFPSTWPVFLVSFWAPHEKQDKRQDAELLVKKILSFLQQLKIPKNSQLRGLAPSCLPVVSWSLVATVILFPVIMYPARTIPTQ